MIRVFKIEVSKEQLARLTPADRRLFILSGHTLNTLTVWLRLTRMSSNARYDQSLAETIRSAQTGVIVRALIGAVAEAWQWFNSGGTRGLVQQKYVPVMDKDAAAGLKKLDRLFNSGRLTAMRNELAYHYPSEAAIEAAFDRCPASEDWSLYVTEHHTSSSYLLSETVVARIQASDLRDHLQSQSPRQDFEVTMDDAVNAASEMASMLACLMSTMMQVNLSVPAPTIILDVHAPNAKKVALPFFLEWPVTPATDSQE